MIAVIQQILQKHWEHIPNQEKRPDPSEFLVTKFAQPLIWPDRKVLFFVTYKGMPICIIKTVRNSLYNEKLRYEKMAQEYHKGHAPTVYFEDMFDGRYIYAEEVLVGETLSTDNAQRKESDIVALCATFATGGKISSKKCGEILKAHMPLNDTEQKILYARLIEKNTSITLGNTHGDLGRTNVIIGESGAIQFIDWERANEVPVWLIDAVYFMVRIRKVRTLKEWQEKASGAFVEYTGVEAYTGEVIYALLRLLNHLHKHTPEGYIKVCATLKGKLELEQ